MSLFRSLQRFVSARFAPHPDAWLEAIGYALAGLGIFLGLACYSYEPSDYFQSYIKADQVQNLAGPLGARIAAMVLHGLGLVGIALPATLVLWGSLVSLGFLLAPSAKRFAGFAVVLMIAPAVLEVQLRRLGMQEPSFGFGGTLGKAVAMPLIRQLGFLGSLVALLAALFSFLSLSGNLSLSQTGPTLRRLNKKFFKFSGDFLRAQFFSIPKEEEMVREALERIALAAKQKRGEIAPDLKASDILSAIREKSSASASGEKSAGKASASDQSDSDAISSDTVNFYFQGPAGQAKPSAALFSKSETAVPRKEAFEKLAKKLTGQLAQFKVEGKIVNIVEGPVVTTCEFEPAPGTKISKITGLAEDLARMLEAKSLRILAPIPGKNTVGFEVPNAKRRSIGFADLIESKVYKSSKMALPIALGVDTFGAVMIEDLTKMPHLLVAGSTGSGKSVFMNTLIASLICRHTAKDLRFIMVDPKMVELAAYNKLPHMAAAVVTDPTNDAKSKLDALVIEMEARFKRMGQVGARNIDGFNEIVKAKKKSNFEDFDGPWQPMPYIVLIIDELADMMMVLGKDAEIPITRLAQKARAAGIHLVIATQRPSAEVVTGLIKANFPTRIAFRVLSGLDSRTILDSSGAETLLGQGDMLYLSASGLRRMHGAYLSDQEVQSMVKATVR